MADFGDVKVICDSRIEEEDEGGSTGDEENKEVVIYVCIEAWRTAILLFLSVF